MNFVYSLNYSRRYKGRYAAKSLKYDKFDSNDIEEFKRQFPLIEKQLTFNDFFTFIEELFDRDQMMTAIPPNKEHILREIAAVGSYCGDKEFYMKNLPIAKKLLDEFTKDLRYMNATPIEKWEQGTQKLLNCDLHALIENTLIEYGLEAMPDYGMEYHRIGNYLQRLKTAIYSYYPALQKLHKKIWIKTFFKRLKGRINSLMKANIKRMFLL